MWYHIGTILDPIPLVEEAMVEYALVGSSVSDLSGIPVVAPVAGSAEVSRISVVNRIAAANVRVPQCSPWGLACSQRDGTLFSCHPPDVL
jgi:hypothetical protein